MKITIKKFMELQNVNFSTPAKIEAGHDVGKSTIFRAVLFAITGKDVTGKDFDGCIYPKKSDRVEDLYAEVQIEQSGVIFCKVAKGSEKRAKGSEETTLQKSVTATYMIDFNVVTKQVYDEKIQEVFGNFQLFCNPDYFRNLAKDEKRKIFSSLVEIDKLSYFSGIPDKTISNGKLSEQLAAIAAKQANLTEFNQVQKPEPIEIIDYKSKIDELQKQRNEMQPRLTEDQENENIDINLQIYQLEKSVFIPEKLLPYWSDPEKPKYIDVDYLQNELIKVQISEPNTMLYDSQIKNLQEKIKQIKSLSLQIENYDENVKSAKCTVCQVCTDPDCQFKRIEIKSLSELTEELSRYMSIESAESSLQNAESQKIDYLRKFHEEKSKKFDSLQQQIFDAEQKNDSMKANYWNQHDIICNENSDIFQKNSEISQKNSQNSANFETEKAQKIQALKSKLHERPVFNPFEIDDKIHELAGSMTFQQFDIDNYNKKLGAYNHAQKRISEISVELQEMKSVLIKFERDIIAYEDAEKRYYNDFEAKINSEMPENVKVYLFRKNLSNDGYSECFDIEFNGSIYAGNGKTISFYIFLCKWFQSKFGKDLPVFIDEAIILNEKLYSDAKNAVILMRNDNYNTLKITEL